VCEKCASRFEEYDRNADARDAGLLQWNVSQHDPFWRDWLLSFDLFAAVRDIAPRVGKRIHSVAGGDVYECLRGVYACWLQVWVAEAEVLVAYPPLSDLYKVAPSTEGFHEFEGWIDHLRRSPPLELGCVRGRCRYGAASVRVGEPPVVKWAQAGDWAAAARTWNVGESRQLAPWP
jgi:hypothetical protein